MNKQHLLLYVSSSSVVITHTKYTTSVNVYIVISSSLSGSGEANVI